MPPVGPAIGAVAHKDFALEISTGILVTTTSSSCRYCSGLIATENCSGVAATVPTTRPTDLPVGS
jgi:hypothetical protein